MYSVICCCKTILYNNSKRFGWTVVCKILLMGLIVVLPWFYGQHNTFSAVPARSFIYNPFNLLVSLGFSIITAVILFQYLHESKAASFLHSLPWSRTQLFVAQSLTAVVFSALPLLLTGMAVSVMHSSAPGQIGDIWVSLLGLFVMEILLFAFTATVGMFTGHASAQVILTLVLYVLPGGMICMLLVYADAYLYGLPDLTYFVSERWLAWHPALRLFSMVTTSLRPLEYVAYMLAALALLAVAWFCYRRRPLERAGDLIVFAAFKPVFKYGFTFCVMLTGTLFIRALWSDSPIFLVLWALIGYCVAEILLKKSFRIIGAYKGFLGYMVFVVALGAALSTGFFGYERRIPPLEEIASAVLAPGVMVNSALKYPEPAPYTWPYYSDGYDGGWRYDQNVYADMSQPDNIQLLRQLHQAWIDQADRADRELTTCYLMYRLNDGSFLTRAYDVDREDQSDLFRQLVDTAEYREELPFASLNPAEVQQTEIQNLLDMEGRQAIVLSAQDSAGLLTALQLDSRSVSPQALLETQNIYRISCQLARTGPIAPPAPPSNLATFLPDRNAYAYVNFWINPAFTHSMQWLDDNGKSAALHLTSPRISQIILYADNSTVYPSWSSTLLMSSGPRRSVSAQAEAELTVTVTDPVEIARFIAAERDWLNPDNPGYGGEDTVSVVYYAAAAADQPMQVYRYAAFRQAAPDSIAPYVEQLFASMRP
jgi:ABC-2 type transport system permease protein